MEERIIKEINALLTQLFSKMKEAGYEWDAEKKELKKIELKSIKTCAEYYNNGRELRMPVLSDFQDKLADILMQREYDGPDETEDDIAKGRLGYELAAIRLSEELLPLAQKEPKTAWSEEDEKIIIELVGIFESAIDGGYVDIPYRLLKDYIRVLKSCLPQTAWKPSEEQMRVLDLAIRCGINRGTTEETTLVSLFNNLKKLREE